MSRNHDDLINEWKVEAMSSRESIKNFLDDLPCRVLNHNELKAIHSQVFIEIDCLRCANCCKTTPPIFTHDDVIRASQFLNISEEEFIFQYTIEDVDGTLVGISVPCTFLAEDNKCKIYNSRPEACRSYPHTDDINFKSQSQLNYNNTKVCPAAYHIVRRLQKLDFIS